MDEPFNGLTALKWMCEVCPFIVTQGRNGNLVAKFGDLRFSTSRSLKHPYDEPNDHGRLFFQRIGKDGKPASKKSNGYGSEVASWKKLKQLVPEIKPEFDWRPNEVIPEDYYA